MDSQAVPRGLLEISRVPGDVRDRRYSSPDRHRYLKIPTKTIGEMASEFVISYVYIT